MSDASPGLALPRRDRLVALASLIALAALAWLYLWHDAAPMGDMADPPTADTPMADAPMADMPSTDTMAAGAAVWGAEAPLLTFLMWAIMMVGMMLPSAAPAILLYGAMVRRHRAQGSVLPAVWVFAAGYLAVWTLFSLAAALLQAGLQSAALVTPMMVSASAPLTGALLVAAGVYQWLPVKYACLEKCRAPLSFFMMHWRPGTAGAFRMGVGHGLFCVACCWALMLLLFVAGVMNLVWVAVLAGFVLVEKLLPAPRLVGRLAGAALVALGAALIADGSLLASLSLQPTA